MSRDIAIDLAKVSMSAAMIIAISREGAKHPLAADCARLRGFKMEKFLSWAERISQSFSERSNLLDHLIRESIRSFRKKRVQRPEELPELQALSNRINLFLDRFR